LRVGKKFFSPETISSVAKNKARNNHAVKNRRLLTGSEKIRRREVEYAPTQVFDVNYRP